MARRGIHVPPYHRPGQGGVRDSPRQFGVDEIADPSCGVPEWNQWSHEIHYIHHTSPTFSRRQVRIPVQVDSWIGEKDTQSDNIND
jgi:hypothetical protein